jgi:hypothetical protein
MASKVPGFSSAVGYWGPNAYCRVSQDETAAKIRALLQDQLFMNGRPVFLWQPVASTTAGVVACTCDKDTSQTADYKCMSCYGMRFVPGYEKFLFETIHFSSAEAGSYTLTTASIDRSKKPNRVIIAAGSTTAVIETTDKAFSNVRGRLAACPGVLHRCRRDVDHRGPHCIGGLHRFSRYHHRGRQACRDRFHSVPHHARTRQCEHGGEPVL